MTTPEPDPARPALRIVGGGEPTDEEVAALVAAFAVATHGGTDDQPGRQASRWASRADMLRRPLRPGPGAWRAHLR